MSDIATVIVTEEAGVAVVQINQGIPGVQGPAGPAGPGAVLTYGGSRGAPTLVATNAQIPLVDTPRQMIFLAGNGGPVTGVNLPAPVGTQQEVILFGCSDANKVQLVPGANTEANYDTYDLVNKSIYRFYRDGAAGTKWTDGGPNGF
jgi:hypothetical protein